MARRGVRILAALVMVVVLAAPACGWGGADDLPAAERICDLGRHNRQGVAGHDLAASTRLPDGRVLFAFGDTYLGTVEGDVRETTGLLNQSAAVIPAGEGICSDRIHYLTGADGEVRGLLGDPPAEDQAYWPVDVAVRGEKVWMIYRWIERTGDGTLDLDVRGTGLAVADVDDLEFHAAYGLLVDGPTPLPTALFGQGDDLVALVCGEGGRDDCRLREVDTDTQSLGAPLRAPRIDLAAAEMGLGRVGHDGDQRWRISALPLLCGDIEVGVLADDTWELDSVLDTESESGGLCYAGRVQEAFSGDQVLYTTWVDSPKRRSDADAYWPHVERIDLREG